MGSGSDYMGKTIREIGLLERFGVVILGLKTSTSRVVSPDGDTVINPGDELFLVGTPKGIDDVRSELR